MRWTPVRILEAITVASLLGIAGFFTRQVSTTLEATQRTLAAQAETDAELAATQRELKAIVTGHEKQLDRLRNDVGQVREWAHDNVKDGGKR